MGKVREETIRTAVTEETTATKTTETTNKTVVHEMMTAVIDAEEDMMPPDQVLPLRQRDHRAHPSIEMRRCCRLAFVIV